jgi:aminoglycoside 3-N-acetyltransferase
MPTFDRERSIPTGMGILPVAVLADAESRRSDHPLCSWAAVGPLAGELVADHDLEDPFGPRSPLGRARDLGAQILLIGVDQRRNSAVLHAHCLADVPAVRRAKGPFLASVHGQRRWLTPKRLAECTEGYRNIEDELVVRGLVRCALCGDARLRLMPMDPVVTEVELILHDRPDAVSCGRPTCRACSAA